MAQVLKRRASHDSHTPRERDLYTWVQEQVALLQAGRVGEIDAAGIADELADVGLEQYDKLEGALAVLLQHMLKWDCQPARRSRSWTLSIAEHRRRVLRLLKRNPGLARLLDEAIRAAYADGRDRALDETGLDEAAIPAECPYSLDDITTRAFTYDPALHRLKD
jgi:hypothetical protein